MKKIILLFLVFIFISNAFASRKATVSGKVIDEKRFPVSGINVSINGVNAVTDKSGNFKVADADIPYRAIVYDASMNITVIYDDLSISNPNLILFGRTVGKNANTAYVNVIIDSIPTTSRGIIKFISQYTNFCKEEEITSGELRKQISVKWPEGERSINGTILYLEKDGSKYTRYAQRNVTLYNDYFPQDIKLTSFNTYSGLNSSILTVYLPALEYASKGFTIWADILGYDRNSEIKLVSENATIQSADVLVPSMLPLSFKLKVRAECFNGKGDGFINYTYVYPGSVVNLTSEDPPELASPSNDMRNVTEKTTFSFTQGSGAGVYVVNFHCLYPESNVYIVTTARQMYMPPLSQGGFPKNANFTWNVAKYIPYFNTDAIVKPLQFNNEYSYQAISYSKTYTFKTQW